MSSDAAKRGAEPTGALGTGQAPGSPTRSPPIPRVGAFLADLVGNALVHLER